MSQREIELERAREVTLEMHAPVGHLRRPSTRAECGTERPCPFVSCAFHLFLEVMPNGNLVLRFPDLEPWELSTSCALDVAEEDGRTVEDVGAMLNITRERVRQLEVVALAKMRDRGVLSDLATGRTGSKRHLPIVR